MSYAVNCELAGIPAVALCFADQIGFGRSTALITGCPNVRWIDVPRMGSGEERVAQFIDQIPKAFIDPLTETEKESGLYVPPPPPRIVFQGTLDEAQEFYQQTISVANCRNCPIAKFTDGLPIIIPTEEKVAEMMTGTSHSPEDAIIPYYKDETGAYTHIIQSGSRAGEEAGPVTFARAYTATVEKVAVIAVMAGCKPEYLPVVLAIATTGGASTSCPGTSSAAGYLFIASGPISKEIGMNPGQNSMDVGNPANMAIGRTAPMMTINFGQCITGVIRSDAGNPIHGVTFAEDEEGLPPGWETLREDKGGYGLEESAIGKVGGPGFRGTVQEYAPSSFRGLIGEGYGGMARRLGVEGIPGPHNFLEYVAPLYISAATGGRLFVMHLNMATSLYDYGFKTKSAVYEWLWNTYFITAKEYSEYGWFDFSTSGGTRTESTSGMKWNDLIATQPDYPIHAFGSSPASNCIIVANSFADELCWTFTSTPRLYPIDPWR